MNKFSSIVFSVFIVLLLFACKESANEVEVENKRETTNFRQTTWGMTKEEVKSNENALIITENDQLVLYKMQHMDMPSETGYLFKNGKLMKGAYLFTENYKDHDDYIKTYEKIKASLINEYGPPSLDEVKWLNQETANDKTPGGKEVCNGEAIYKTEWITEDTLIMQLLEGSDHKCRQGIVYQANQNNIIQNPQPVQKSE